MSAISRPAPIAEPLMAAMTGLSRSSRARTIRCTPSQTKRFMSHDLSLPSAMSFMSPPEQKVSPFPVTMMTLAASSVLAASRYSRQRRIISGLNAFFTSGLLSVMKAILSLISYRTCFSSMAITVLFLKCYFRAVIQQLSRIALRFYLLIGTTE